MEILLILTYAAICYGIFKLFRIPINKWTVPTAVLGGIFIIFFILLVMNYNHPFSKEARLYFYTTPIVPIVRGPVIEVPVQSNVPLKKGDVLFKIDPRPYQYAVTQKQAALQEAEQTVKEQKASLDEASAAAKRFQSQVDLAQLTYDRQVELKSKEVIAQATVDTATRNLDTAKQALAGAQAAEERARLTYSSQINGVNTTVARLQAELDDAQYNLDQTVYRAPTDGYVTQLFLKPGMMAVPLPLRPVMVFIHSDDNIFAVAFQQNALQRVRVGDEAEIAFDAIPGRIFKGRIKAIVDAVVQGQLQPSGSLLDPEERGKSPGRALAIVDILDDLSGYQLPAGSTAQVATYTEYWHHFAILRRVLLRMKGWLNYVFTEGH
jgi:multidrug resistance efflux pump